MRFDVLTIFPQAFPGPLGIGVVGRALGQGLLDLRAHDLRDWAEGRHRQVDDTPFGGGAGMVLKPEPIMRAVAELRVQEPALRPILMSPHGRRFTQGIATELAHETAVLLVCGRYQGVDERAVEEIGEQLSVGDFVISGGELAAMIIIEATIRLVPGVLGSPGSLEGETFTKGGAEPPLYTRPAEYLGRPVPEVLRSGHHAAIQQWRREQQQEHPLRPQAVHADRPGALPGGTP